MKKHNWGNIEEAKEYEKPTPGGYICGITNVIDDEQFQSTTLARGSTANMSKIFILSYVYLPNLLYNYIT